MRLTPDDYAALERCYITPPIAQAAGLFRVPSIEGRDLVGRKGGGDYSGVVFPLTWPGEPAIALYRLRLDHPPVDLSNGKPQHKYLTAAGARNRLYMPLEDPALLQDVEVPIVMTEGEKKYLALHRLAHEQGGNGTGKPAFIPMALFGVWGWRGIIGYTSDAHGNRVEQKGPIPDLDRVKWEGRRVYLCYDANAATNEMVRVARGQAARELESRGAMVWVIDLPQAPGVNGVDDFLAAAPSGPQDFLSLMQAAIRYRWRDELARNEKGKILPGINNVLLALRLAPAWHGVLGFNEFALVVEARRQPPWGGLVGRWSDTADLLTSAWLERQGIVTSDLLASKAVQTVARDHPFHPVRDYLDGLEWDGIERLDDWLTLYLGVKPGAYVRAVGKRWYISGVARARKPGCQVDHTLILEGLQGIGKSSVFKIIGGEFYSDDIAELGTKDASLSAAGAWIIELAELDAMGRADISKIKAFLSRSEDRFRPPYGRHLITAPRQCIFGGSVNVAAYLKDETGGRRFWPVTCGRINLEALRRDRDQLWAEADARYNRGEPWWLDTAELNREAAAEQEARYQTDPWEPEIDRYLLSRTEVTTSDVLENAIKKDRGQWTRADEMRVAAILRRLGWEAGRRGSGGSRRRIYELREAPVGV